MPRTGYSHQNADIRQCLVGLGAASCLYHYRRLYFLSFPNHERRLPGQSDREKAHRLGDEISPVIFLGFEHPPLDPDRKPVRTNLMNQRAKDMRVVLKINIKGWRFVGVPVRGDKATHKLDDLRDPSHDFTEANLQGLLRSIDYPCFFRETFC